MKQRRIVDYLVYLVVRVLICLVQGTRIETGHLWAKRLAWLLADVMRPRGKLVDENLRLAFPEKSDDERRQIARRMWEHLFLLVLEVAHAPRKIHETNWRRHVRLEGVDDLVRILLGERPVIIITAHFGNFEVGGFMLGILGFPTYSVARTLDNPYLHRYVDRFRQLTGQHLIPKKGGYDQILDVLASAGTLAFLADQAAGTKDCWVDFFGRPASTYKAIALLSLQHDAPMAVCYARRLDRPLQFEMVTTAIVDPRDVPDGVGSVHDLTQWYTSQLEEAIRRSPEQYWWIHRRWKDRPRRRKSGKSKAA
ncbi:MAG: lysophospholipid acyltransferase family protein [Planctomycetota bacterium]